MERISASLNHYLTSLCLNVFYKIGVFLVFSFTICEMIGNFLSRLWNKWLEATLDPDQEQLQPFHG